MRNFSMFAVPDEFRRGPFTRAAALEGGIPRGVLQGPQFVRIHHGVYRHVGHQMSWRDKVQAARLALPSAARTTGVTRLQELGFDVGPREPLHFVMEGDHHLVLDGVFLHRTVLMPPHDDQGVSVEAAFIAWCAETRVIDAVKVGSMLLHAAQLSREKLQALLDEQPWRLGVTEARWVLPHLDGRCRSLPEAELLALVRAAGLPEPEVNHTLSEGSTIITPDLWFARYRRAVEYEGAQHQEDRDQYVADIDRYAVYRRMGAGYVQVTKERMRTPRTLVRQVHAELVAGGYEGPPPAFGPRWSMLFQRLASVVDRRRPPSRRER